MANAEFQSVLLKYMGSENFKNGDAVGDDLVLIPYLQPIGTEANTAVKATDAPALAQALGFVFGSICAQQGKSLCYVQQTLPGSLL